MAIENARLFEEARDRARRLEAVREIATAILDGTDSDQVLGLVARHARELVEADLATLAVPAGPGELLVGAADGVHADELAGTVFPIEGSVSGEVIRTGKTVVLADAAGDERVRQPALRAGAIGPALFAPPSWAPCWWPTRLEDACSAPGTCS